jgi:hypothetical protein
MPPRRRGRVGFPGARKGRTVGGMQDGLGFRVPALLQSSPLVATVELCGSRALGTECRYSDWDFSVSTRDFAAFVPELPGLVRALDPLVEQWDRLSDESCYMLIVDGPTKVDLIFAEVPHEHDPPWVVDGSTLSGIDDHFWDWVLWLLSKVDAGNDALVAAQLMTMHEHLLAPMGISEPTTSLREVVEQYISARDLWAERLGLVVDPSVEYEVLPIVHTVCRDSPDDTPT